MSNKGFYGRRMVPEYLIKKLEEGPAKIKDISNITALTNDEINTLEAGDIVLKKTSNQYHAYIVSYKEENQGICLTYTDADTIETVSYDYVEGNWVYNSTDVTSMPILKEKQDELVSGENIKTINGQSLLGDGNINISGGFNKMHCIFFYGTYSAADVSICLNLYNNIATPFNDMSELISYLSSLKDSAKSVYIVATGVSGSSNIYTIRVGTDGTLYFVYGNNALLLNNINVTGFIDVVR